MLVLNHKFWWPCSETYITVISEINDETVEAIEKRVAAALAVVSAATLKVVEDHNDENTDINKVSIADAVVADVSTNNTDKDGNNSDGDLISNASTRKLGLTRLQKLVLIGGPDDGVISPWQSRFLYIIC